MLKGSLIVTVGISGSGKSTFAKEKFEEAPLTTVIINRDKVRELLFGYTEGTIGKYYQRADLNKLEKIVTQYEDTLIYESLEAGKLVIVDATHLEKKYIERFKIFNVDVEIVFFDISLNDAIDRDDNRPRYVGESVITKQYNKYKSLKDNFLSWKLWCYMRLVGDYPLVLKEHPLYTNYFGGSDGNIYSTRSINRGGVIEYNGDKYRKLIGHKGGTSEYLSFTPCIPSSKKAKMIHKFIYECFYNNIPNENVRECVSHLDGDHFNNKPNNLTSETYSKNLKRKLGHGTDDRFYRNSRSSLTKEEFAIMKNILDNKLMKHEDIANVFGVTRTYVSKMNCKIKKYEG